MNTKDKLIDEVGDIVENEVYHRNTLPVKEANKVAKRIITLVRKDERRICAEVAVETINEIQDCYYCGTSDSISKNESIKAIQTALSTEER